MVRIFIIIMISALLHYSCKPDLIFPTDMGIPQPITMEPSNVSESGAMLRGKINPGSWENTGSLQYGFITFFDSNPTMVIDTFYIGYTTVALEFEYYMENNLFTDTELSVRAFARKNNQFFLGNITSIFITGGTIIEVIPATGVRLDTVLIIGTRFRNEVQDIQVQFRNSQHSISANIIEINGDTIKVIIPNLYPVNVPYEVWVRYKGNGIKKENAFQIRPPQIESFYPLYGYEGDIVTIVGKYLGYPGYPSWYTRVFWGDDMMQLISVSNTEIKVLITGTNVRENKLLKVRYSSNIGTSPFGFQYLSPWKFMLKDAEIFNESIFFSVNGEMYHGSPYNDQISWMRKIFRYDPVANTFERVSIFPIHTYNASSFVINNRAFVLTGYSDPTHDGKLFEFIPGNPPSWQERGRFPHENQITGGKTSLVIDNRAFVLAGNPDNPLAPNFFEYNPQNDTWMEAPQFPLPAMPHALSFVINNKGYVVTGKINNVPDRKVYRFDLATNSWEQVADFPVPLYKGFGFAIDGKAYAGMGQSPEGWMNRYVKLHMYDPETDQWSLEIDPPANISSRGEIIGVTEEKVYIGFPTWDRIFEFDPAYLKENYQPENQ